jgi:hypothetical protein
MPTPTIAASYLGQPSEMETRGDSRCCGFESAPHPVDLTLAWQHRCWAVRDAARDAADRYRKCRDFAQYRRFQRRFEAAAILMHQIPDDLRQLGVGMWETVNLDWQAEKAIEALAVRRMQAAAWRPLQLPPDPPVRMFRDNLYEVRVAGERWLVRRRNDHWTGFSDVWACHADDRTGLGIRPGKMRGYTLSAATAGEVIAALLARGAGAGQRAVNRG